MKTPVVVLLSVGISLMAFSPLWAATIHVDSDKGDDLRNGTAAEPKATIGAAMAVAAAGDRILVAPGEYAESINVTLSRIVLAATRPGRVRLDGRLTLKCNDTVIDGLSWSGHNGGAILNIYGKAEHCPPLPVPGIRSQVRLQGHLDSPDRRPRGQPHRALSVRRLDRARFQFLHQGQPERQRDGLQRNSDPQQRVPSRRSPREQYRHPDLLPDAGRKQHHLRLRRRHRRQGRRQHDPTQRGVSLLGGRSHEQSVRLEQPLREQPVVRKHAGLGNLLGRQQHLAEQRRPELPDDRPHQARRPGRIPEDAAGEQPVRGQPSRLFMGRCDLSGRPHPLPPEHVHRRWQDRNGRTRTPQGNRPGRPGHLGKGPGRQGRVCPAVQAGPGGRPVGRSCRSRRRTLGSRRQGRANRRTSPHCRRTPPPGEKLHSANRQHPREDRLRQPALPTPGIRWSDWSTRQPGQPGPGSRKNRTTPSEPTRMVSPERQPAKVASPASSTVHREGRGELRFRFRGSLTTAPTTSVSGWPAAFPKPSIRPASAWPRCFRSPAWPGNREGTACWA